MPIRLVNCYVNATQYILHGPLMEYALSPPPRGVGVEEMRRSPPPRFGEVRVAVVFIVYSLSTVAILAQALNAGDE